MDSKDIDVDGLDVAVLRSLEYSNETGEVRWSFCGVSRRRNQRAGYMRKDGYIDIDLTVGGRVFRLKAHRVAWFLHYGSWPTKVLDHINGNKHDNRISNLRDVTQQENTHNVSTPRSNSRTGYLGVQEHKDGTFKSMIQIEGKEVVLGFFYTKAEAAASYVTAKRLLHKGFLG